MADLGKAQRMRDIGRLYEQFWRIRTNGGQQGQITRKLGRAGRMISPKSQVTIEAIRDRALQISRMSEDPKGTTSEEKRLTTILLKEIEMYIAARNDNAQNITPIKTLTSIKSHGHLRMRTSSANRSVSSLNGPILIN
jgi:hypothetical protein